jgi:hypothetical protein
MLKNYKKTSLDYTNAITDSHNEENHALNVISANSLVPDRYGKIELTYILSGPASGCIEYARYYSEGTYQESKIIFRGDSAGTAQKATINFINRTPASLAGKAFVIYDNFGAVKVWYNVDFASTEPSVSGTYRSIVVNLLSSHTADAIASRTALALDTDSEFLAISSINYVIISSSSVGTKPDAYDFNTSLYIKNTPGKNPESLNNKYFFLNSANNANQYYIWYNVNGSGVDPAIVGKTGLMVAISTGSTALQVAAATKIIVDSTGKFITNINEDTLTIINNLIGVTVPASEQTSGFLVITTTLGESRELVATVLLSYDLQGNLIGAERL